MRKTSSLMLSLFLIAGSAFILREANSNPAFTKAPECIKDGVKYGVTRGSFRSEWWNYLERGMSYLEGGCYEFALADLDKAIELRRKQVKNEHDKRRARTYGLHFVDYFAHREKGIALYHLGRYDESKAELEQSLKWVDSERARQYLGACEASERKKSRLKSLAHKYRQ